VSVLPSDGQGNIPVNGVPAVIRRLLGPDGHNYNIATLMTAMHSEQDCLTPCAFHRPRAHPLATEPIRVRVDQTNPTLAVTERRCPHDPTGVRWHPDPDQALFLAAHYPAAEYAIALTHTCDCCCLAARNWLLRAGAPVAPKPAGRVFVTTAFSLYEVHLGDDRVRRLQGLNEPTPNFKQDGRWRHYAALTPPAVGVPFAVLWTDGSGTTSSPAHRIDVTLPPAQPAGGSRA
jgi:hypothetical protein